MNDLTNCNANNLHIIRVFTAWCVLLGHAFSFFQLTVLKNDAVFPYIQSLAVLVFFLLSGFLTDYSLSRKDDNYRYKNYLIDRFSRIYSVYFPSLVFILIADGLSIYLNSELYSHYESYNIITFLKNIFMFPHNYQVFGSGRPLWTLYIEWWLYVCYGYYVLICKKKCKKKLGLEKVIILAILIYVPLIGSEQTTIMAFVLGIIIGSITNFVG